MKRFAMAAGKIIFGAGFLAAMTACGNASNNDQGVAFTNLGYFALEEGDGDDEEVCSLETGLTGLFVPLTYSDFSEAPGMFSTVFVCLGVQNNMTSQAIRTQRVRVDYYIEGAAVQPPSTSVPFTAVLGPVQIESEDGSAVAPGTLPAGFNAPNRVVGGAGLIPPEVRSWLALNRAQLPEAPFSMLLTTRVVGITSAGDQLESNPADLYVEITPDTTIP